MTETSTTAPTAQYELENGLELLRQGKPKEAAAAFHAGMQALSHTAAERGRMRCLSFYGYSLALAGESTSDALRACEVAARRAFFDPDVLLNLGRVYDIVGRTTLALATFERGLKIDSRHVDLRQEIERIERRGRPVFPFLGRNHALNQMLGKMRASFGRSGGGRAGAAPSGKRSVERRAVSRPASPAADTEAGFGNRTGDGLRQLTAQPLRRRRPEQRARQA
jgi:hypothetical protein